jgi:hypothetical protein
MNKVKDKTEIRAEMMYGYVGSSNVGIHIQPGDHMGWDGVKLVNDYGETMFEGKVEDAARYILDLKNGKYVW